MSGLGSLFADLLLSIGNISSVPVAKAGTTAPVKVTNTPPVQNTPTPAAVHTAPILTTRIPTINPAVVSGLSSPARSSNVLPANVGPARESGNFVGTLPAGVLLPSNVIATQGYNPGHTALDLAGPQGTKIYAPESLRITQAGAGAFGIDVIGINPATGNRFTFGHFEAVAPGLNIGEVVPAGTLLGFEGSTFTPPGYSTGPHLHLQENLPGGGAIMPSAQDVLNTFVTGLTVPTPSAPSVTYTGNVNAPAPAANISALVNNPAHAAAANTTSQTARAVNSRAAASPAVTPESSAAVTTAPAAEKQGTSAASSGTSIFDILGASSFIKNHTALDYGIMALGLLMILIGSVSLVGTMIKGEYNRELNVIDKTSTTLTNATKAAGPLLGGK